MLDWLNKKIAECEKEVMEMPIKEFSKDYQKETKNSDDYLCGRMCDIQELVNSNTKSKLGYYLGVHRALWFVKDIIIKEEK